MDQYLQQARTLIEALPYIRKFNQSIVVIKYGGSAMMDSQRQRSIIQDIALMKLVGMKPVVVHGGGPHINQMLARLGISTTFHKGLRVTDDETMAVVEMVLSGQINKGIVKEFQKQGIKAVGISGKDGALFSARKRQDVDIDLGWVGEIDTVQPDLLQTLMDKDFVPVIAPIAADADGNSYNINADSAASATAVALKAEKLVYLTDVDGVLRDVNDRSSIISRIHVDDIPRYCQSKVVQGGMLPKIENCATSIRQGVSSVHILDGRLEHSLLLEIFTNSGIGTMVHG